MMTGANGLLMNFISRAKDYAELDCIIANHAPLSLSRIADL